MEPPPARIVRHAVLLLLVFFLASCEKNEHEPEVPDQEFYLDENSSKGTIIGAVIAEDPDEGQTVRFEILDGNAGSVFFLEPRTGILSVNDSTLLDFEKHPEFELLISVSDDHAKNPRESSARIMVYLNNLNEYAPVIENQVFQIQEDCSAGTRIGTITATDRDPGQILSFKIESGNDKQAVFLDSLSGDLLVNDPACFDFEQNQILVFLVSACDNDEKSPLKSFASVTIEIQDVSMYTASLSGFAQKGPFINGTNITISELNGQLQPTGKVFITQAIDNSGAFEIRDIELESRYLHLKSDGYYFNERTGELSEAPVSLSSIIDITNTDSSNINILTHLEKERIEYLVRTGTSFDIAKDQAQEEVLDILSFPSLGTNASGNLNISQSGDDNAKLLAASIIFQGTHSAGEFSELINEISTDIKADGRLNDADLGSELVNHAMLADPSEIRSNLENRYSDMGADAIIPDFEKYLKLFQDSSDFEFNSLIEYPEFSEYGENILFGTKDEFLSMPQSYSMAAEIPVGNTLKIRLTGGIWGIRVMPDGPVNWEYTQFDDENLSQVFTAKEANTRTDLSILFEFGDSRDPYSVTIDYFENSSEVPTRTKVIHITMHPEYYK